MTTDPLPQVLRDWVDAQNEHDSVRHASLYTPDGISGDVANGFAARGHDTGAVIDQLGVTAERLAGIGRVFGPHGRKREGGA